MDDLTAALKERALAEGFDLVGVAAAAEATGAAHLRRWLASGRHAGMAWMARNVELRSDPRRLLPGCRSVVAVAMSYRTSHQASLDGVRDRDRRVWVSRYAWGRDYHDVLRRRLVRLGRWLETERPGAGWRACVDTAPVLEREWAARAGLGWIGKNTSLLNRRLGSELFLGVLMTTAPLAPDGPVSDHCGRCTACLDACPAGAFPGPRVLDARRCIAYLTVEHRGPVAEELRPAMGSMVAGCDICQEVCPWTRRAPADLHDEFAPAAHRLRPPLAELEALDEEGYRAWRQGSALRRIPFAQFRHSLAIVRANLDRRGAE
ncbi:MAG TPA: tRNA epoxyqueuosine(34) reductase QueG [Thermoanaerobaculales bacterium]|nr:tRNA epoxyqueuosine(34) reductase QueG [Thermoanaerobaculales bacterium]HPA80989.1 tRNA epoxyqueuosine(34) reductase QueG [Thermoanaerobaculales bacterium]HQN95336.1 tRNA epoxyqueuosine(34) reductase QueG [Thermoanaerobaculales bacterium]HRZ10390.1 tRNA epoxyqueuosine(34) reductase QueG [Gemmatimonadales bacterium]